MTEKDQSRLNDALSRVRKRIEQVKIRRESIGEQNTKSILIDPILRALGWDPEELEEVCREYKRKPQDNPVDYAFFLLRSPCLFVEAKALDKDLQDRKWISQILGYATVVGVEWCVLTNGDEYRIYNSHAAVDIDEKLFRTIRVSDETKEQFTLDTLDLLSKNKMGEKLINTLWKAHFIDHRVKAALAEILNNEDGALARLVRKKIPGLSRTEIRDSLGRADFRVDFPAVPTREPVKIPFPHTEAKKKPKPPVSISLGDLINAGLLKPPTDLECLYRKANLKAIIQADGTVLYGGSVYDSLSTAAGMARKSIVGTPAGRKYPQTNGWTFWKVRDPQTGEKKEIDALRQDYLKNFGKGVKDR
jgi:predicted type IV restriction endonuclease